MKRILALLLALVMLFCLAACGGDEAGTPTGESTGATTNTSEGTNDTTEGNQDSTQGTTEGTTGGETTETTTPPTTTPTTPPPTTQSTSGGVVNSGNSTSMSFQTLVSRYSGRWYLDGYYDVYLDISLEVYADNNQNDTLNISANNFAVPEPNNDDGLPYPDLHSLSGYCSGLGIIRSQYDYFGMTQYTRNHKISFKEGYICIGSYKFVPTQGSIARVAGITLNKTSLELYVGESETLIATVFPDGALNKKITWYSTADSMVTVSSGGKVTGIAATVPYCIGITAITEDGHHMATCNVTVKAREEASETVPPTVEPPATNPQPVRVSGVQISKTTLSLKVGDTQQLTATVSPSNADNKNVTWSSSNSSVAQVSSTGKITAKGEGTVVITVTTKDGGYTASCNVAVSVVHVNGVSLNQTALNMTVGKSQQLMATVFPSNADNKNVTWSSSNSSVAQVSSTGTVTAKGIGSAIITVSTVDGGYTATCTVTVQSPPAAEQLSDVLIISGMHTISNQTINTDVYITSTGVATFNNVTINGNIYCYGQLKCSGCTANNVYAYAYGSMMSCGAFDGTHGKVSGGISCNEITILDNALNYAFSKWGKK